MKHMKNIFIKCWKCKKDFEITGAERCYKHLLSSEGKPEFTTKCFHCGSCICHKVSKMIPTDCEVLNSEGITMVMPSLARQLKKISSLKED
jgi:hypothetical protein